MVGVDVKEGGGAGMQTHAWMSLCSMTCLSFIRGLREEEERVRGLWRQRGPLY